jgi:uncharacterized protein
MISEKQRRRAVSTDTPKTDAAKIASGFQAVPESFQDHARTLERELTAMTAERDALRAALEESLAQMEEDAVLIDSELGGGYNLAELEKLNRLPKAINAARAALACYRADKAK